MNIGAIFHQFVVEAVSQLSAMKFVTLIEFIYVIQLVKFGVDWSQGWGLVSSQILGFYFYSINRP